MSARRVQIPGLKIETWGTRPDFFSKAQLQRDLWEASQRKRRKIKPLAA